MHVTRAYWLKQLFREDSHPGEHAPGEREKDDKILQPGIGHNFGTDEMYIKYMRCESNRKERCAQMRSTEC